MKKLLILGLIALVGCSSLSTKTTKDGMSLPASIARTNLAPVTDYTVTCPDVFVMVDNTGDNPSAQTLPLSAIKALTVCSNYGSVTIQAASKITGPWQSLATVSSNSVILINSNGTQLFFRAVDFVFNFSVGMSPSPSPGVLGYYIFTGPSTNLFTQTNTIGNVTNVTLSVTGSNIPPILYVRAQAFDGSTNRSALSNIGSLVVPVPNLKLQ